jgi:L-threonylcarbamoyladenylate synthase
VSEEASGNEPTSGDESPNVEEPASGDGPPSAEGPASGDGSLSAEGPASGDGSLSAEEPASEKRPMSVTYDCADKASRSEGIAAAARTLRTGGLIVMPTDTVYGIAADAFYPSAITALLAAKGRGRDVPPPVLVGTVRAAVALIDDLGPYGKDLIDEFWPGGLTLVCRASRTLSWDLGDTHGTVAVRMPLHAVALDLLKETGPLAVSSANRHGLPPATTAAQAQDQLGDSVSVYLDGGPCADDVPSTIVDLTGSVPRLLRAGAVSVGRLREVAALSTGGDVSPDA